MIDDCPLGLMEVIDDVPVAMGEWVIDQTLVALGELLIELARLEVGDHKDVDTRRVEQTDRFARVAGLMTEFAQFAHAARRVADKLAALHELVQRERGEQTDVRPAAA
jgi:hypothetical protein